MIFCYKCKDCEYKSELMVPSYKDYEKFKSENKCPECDGELVTDFSEHNMSFRMEGPKTTSKKEKRMNRANNRRHAPVEHQAKMKKDPYYGFRDKGDKNYKGI